MNKKFKNKKGFTLIEVIAVLVILGLLAAFAVPKFFDLQSRAHQKPIASAVSDIMGRVNQRFAAQLLDGIVVDSVDYSEVAVGTNLGQDFLITNWGWGLGSTQISFDLTFYPNPDNTSLTPVNTSVVLDLPQTGQ
jgi:prepilin-type N-terminal cleavage/methylation domain-containing protein